MDSTEAFVNICDTAVMVLTMPPTKGIMFTDIFQSSNNSAKYRKIVIAPRHSEHSTVSIPTPWSFQIFNSNI